MLRNENNRLTPEGNQALNENLKQIREIYNKWRDEGFSVEEVFYMITTAAHQCVLNESISGKKKI